MVAKANTPNHSDVTLATFLLLLALPGLEREGLLLMNLFAFLF